MKQKRLRQMRAATARALIAKLSQSHCGSRDLDADMYEAVGYLVKRRPEGPHSIAWRYYDFAGSRWLAMNHVSTSVDAALRFLPPGLWFLVAAGKTRADEPLYGCQIRAPDARRDVILGEGEHPSSLALAVCIAVIDMRARKQREGKDVER